MPNPDGTPFFGSPTKLFEYMAMGKGIVASDLEQIGEVLEHGRTAWLVPPGDVDALADGLRRLIDDPALARDARRRGAARGGRRATRGASTRAARSNGCRKSSPPRATCDGPRMKRLLAVSWEMPPMYGPRATQVSRALGELAGLGWRPTAVCLAPAAGWSALARTAPASNRRRASSWCACRRPKNGLAVRAAWRLAPALRDFPDADARLGAARRDRRGRFAAAGE